MNKLIINKGTFKLREVDIVNGTITIGRAADNDIQLNDTAVSGHHAKVVTLMGVTYIKDLGSTNGTIVNGKKIDSYSLKADDMVSIGQHLILFKAQKENDSWSAEETGEHTQLISLSETQRLADMAASLGKQAQNEASTHAKPAQTQMSEPLAEVKNALVNDVHAHNVALLHPKTSIAQSNEEESKSSPQPQQKLTPQPSQEKHKAAPQVFAQTHVMEAVRPVASKAQVEATGKSRRVLKPTVRASKPVQDKKTASTAVNRKVIVEDVLYNGNGGGAAVSVGPVNREQLLHKIILRESDTRKQFAMTSMHKMITLVGGLIILGLSLLILL